MILSDTLNYIPEQKVTIIIDSAVDVSFMGIASLNINSFEIEFTEEKLNDSISCKTELVRQ